MAIGVHEAFPESVDPNFTRSSHGTEMIGMERRIRFQPLPQAPSRWPMLAAGFGVQVPMLALLLTFSAYASWLMPQRVSADPRNRAPVQLTWLQPAEPVTPPPPPAALPVPKLRAPVETFPEPKLVMPRSISAPVPEVTTAAALPAPLPEPRRPIERVVEPPKPQQLRTETFSTGSSAAPTLPKIAPQKVQTGGFGNPNGVEVGPPTNGNGKLIAAPVGSFDLPSGPGHGNGTGGANGTRGVIASAGFGNGTAIEPRSARPAPRVQATNFTQAPAPEPERPTAKPRVPAFVPVSILDKPSPVYTAEARALKLEGEVLLEVVFTAAGRVRVLRLVQGLGHGLDEAAVRAAERIRFSPAQRDNQSVDTTATLHVVFQLS